jgi:hypothetical protein
MRDSSSGDNPKFGDLNLEEAMDLSRDRQILELEWKEAYVACFKAVLQYLHSFEPV